MTETEIIGNEYRKLFGNDDVKIAPLPKSGSDRKYFRVTSKKISVICTLNPVREENEAFIGFTRHFISKGLPVPEIYGYSPSENIYFQKDFGDINFFSWLKEEADKPDFRNNERTLYKKILDSLVLFQTRGIDGLDLDLCYPHRSFDRQSMMWDMNYFKYMFLKLLAVPFNEPGLEADFSSLADYLLDERQDYFLYRDFQSANIMIAGGEPWFIDYQGGRKGAAQYDIASILFDAKINMAGETRDELFSYYCSRFCPVAGTDIGKFSERYYGFTMIRLMQALGAFGFRGLYENKPTFAESIVPGVSLLLEAAENMSRRIALPELYKAIILVGQSPKYRELQLRK
ncbi:MAG: phosphotransferase [Bacteroidales bacterium]|jgi:aminoglycoside/choline kinase family phosphotransferase